MKKFKKIIWILLTLIILFTLGSLLIFTNINLSNVLFDWNEFQTIEFRDKLIYLGGLAWWGVLIFIFVCTLFYIFKNFRKWYLGIFFMIVIISVWFFIGIGSTLFTGDKFIFANESQISSSMKNLKNKKDLKNKNLKVRGYGLYFRNPVLESGIYAICEVINPTTGLQDKYWYHPSNLLLKWTKSADYNVFSDENTISFDNIPWNVLPRILKDAKKRMKNLTVYHRGISMVLLLEHDNKWCWIVNDENIRGYTDNRYIYSLEGKYITMSK